MTRNEVIVSASVALTVACLFFFCILPVLLTLVSQPIEFFEVTASSTRSIQPCTLHRAPVVTQEVFMSITNTWPA